MKLALIGGGGVRAPLFVEAALRRAERVGLDEIALLDTDAEKLQLIGGLCQAIVAAAGSRVRISQTTQPQAALEGAKYAVAAIRVGGERGRILDERIALKHGVLGQETTGAGGFAMALRSIPAIISYAELLEELSPGAWLFSFTNPAGLVTQALRDAGFSRTIGICDSANGGQHAVAEWLGLDEQQLRAEVFGLNHLSWTRAVRQHGQDLLAPLLHDPGFRAATHLQMFDEGLVEQIGMWLNEYLYYFYYAEKALESIQADEMTRGEEVLELTTRLLQHLRAIDVQRNPQAALQAFYAYRNRRSATYMHYAQADGPSMEEADALLADTPAETSPDSEGYAGVALGLVEALERGEALYTGLNVPNQGAIEGMRNADVVEVSCVVDGSGVHPLPIGPIPEPQLRLMQAIKLYERLTVEAIRTHSRETAVAALMAHPLVLSYSRATVLVDDYLTAHREWVGDWR